VHQPAALVQAARAGAPAAKYKAAEVVKVRKVRCSLDAADRRTLPLAVPVTPCGPGLGRSAWVQTKAYATVLSVGDGKPPVYQVGLSRRSRVARSPVAHCPLPLQVEVRGGEVESLSEAELIGLSEELSKWL
jgi:hypothetical protein